MTFNKDKCTFAAQNIEFLGHCVSEYRIDILPERVSAIAGFPTPQKKEVLMQFLGAVNYIGKYILNKSEILKPLTSLLKKNEHFAWLEPQERAFKIIKDFAERAPTLPPFD